jgi:hypothetical protein
MVQIKICIEPECKNAQTTENFCRLHYLKNWKRIKEATQKKAAEKLNKYVEGICEKSPDKYVDLIRRDLRSNKGELVKGVDEQMTGDPAEVFFDDTGLHDDEAVDKLLSKIKIDMAY